MLQPAIRTASDLDSQLEVLLKAYDGIDDTNIRSFSEAFCRAFWIRKIPRDPLRLLPERLGIVLKRATLAGPSSAQWIRLPFEDLYVIEYSEHRRYPEQLSISLWHEVFEIVSAHREFPNRLTPQAECRLASRFAACVTMPAWSVKKAADEFGYPNHAGKIPNIAARFGVSRSALRVRLKELGLLPRK